jgi:hypothetical protein
MTVLSKSRNFLFIFNQKNISSRNFSECYLKSTSRNLNLDRFNILGQKNERAKNQILATKIRFQSQQANATSNQELKKPFLKTSFLYSLSVVLGGLFGVVTGYWLMRDESQIENDNESVRVKNVYESTKDVSFYIKVKFR